MTSVETYLRAVSEVHASGAAVEASYYTALSNLLNEVGARLKPRVRCIMGQPDRGAGLPDGGFFTPDQFPKSPVREPLKGQIPSRGVIEVKLPKQDAGVTADGEQVSRYWERYKQVLVTNLRDFVLVGRDLTGGAVKLETHRLADSERAFWTLAATPRKADQELGARFVEFLQRVMLHAAPLSAPKDVAWFLASYAREARARIESVNLPALGNVRSALEEALGLKFEGEKGEHFFRSSLVQTLFYGVFSAWVLWSKQRPPGSEERFDWGLAARYLRVPMISRLFYLVADPNQLDALRLSEVLNWTALVLNRVDRGAFFSKFQEAHAVQYFYEPFLEAFDPELRKQLGVWYTPPEIVKYMVERVDAVLRQELDLPLGLADKSVYVLDPCCGTGSYLVEVLDRIHRTLAERGEDALLASDLKDAARNRVFGFEILPAPFVVSHLQLGLLLQNLGAPLSELSKERVGVYLTNALTGWEPPKGPKQRLIFPELEEERDAAEHVKREVPILVILGNPPYNGFAGVSPAEEQGLLEPYKQGLKEWGITKNYLDDLYVRFFRLAERRIAERTGKGIVCYISNFSYLGDPSFVVMRQRFLGEFGKMWFDCMNGDSRQTGKLTPDGKPDPSVFSTQYNREGIRVGTAIALMVRVADGGNAKPTVRFRHFWGVTKRENLMNSVGAQHFDSQYETAQPERTNRYSFRAMEVSAGYSSWPDLTSLSIADPMLGLNDNRSQATHAIDQREIISRMRAYYDPSVSFEQVASLHPGLTSDAASFDAKATRARLQRESAFRDENVRRFWFKPFDLRWAYIERTSNLWNRVRPELLDQAWDSNEFLLARRHAPKCPDGATFFYSRHISDQHVLHTDAYFIPLRLRHVRGRESQGDGAQGALLPDSGAKREDVANISPRGRAYLASLGVSESDADSAGLMWMHALAVGYSPAYLTENADGIRQDWPRIPLPDSRERLAASGQLGRQVASLLDIEAPVSTADDPRLRGLAAFKLGGAGPLDERVHFAMTAGWGHAGKGGVTMPGVGRAVERDFAAQERESLGEAVKLLGDRTLDVYLNESAYWANVPVRVWEYTIGGYQVIKKWLSYREQKLLGRPLTKDEVRYVQDMARRIAAIVLLEPALDANYRAAKGHSFHWPP
jgi:Type ISP C-terminal specificity domain/N-6 DNA Methylase